MEAKLLCLSHSVSPFVAVKNEARSRLSPHRRTRIKKDVSKLMSPVMAATKSSGTELQVEHRRSAHYHPTIWDPKLIDSLTTPYTYASHSTKLEKLKGETKDILKSARDPAVILKHIDYMQRLGVAYHFESEIEEALGIVQSYVATDVYTAALQFRLLRENGFSVSSDVLDKFWSKDGRQLESLSQDPDALLSLYEASHLRMPGENSLEEAMNFSTKNLKSLRGKMDSSLLNKVNQSLEVPLHLRVPRLEAWNAIDEAQQYNYVNPTLLELAKLDHNLAQSVYQQELKELSKWWRKLDFMGRLSFARDRLVENYLVAIALVSEPQFSKCRLCLTKFLCILTAIDDIYDVYGLPHELESFTEAVNRWDIDAVEDLPEYMKICYVALLNFGNELVFDVLTDHGLNISPYMKEQWARLCRSYLVEAQWYHTNYTPTLDEYLNNAWISVGGPATIVHAYPTLGCQISEDTLLALNNSELLYWSSLVTRMWDDLGTSKNESKRGDVPKSVECYMAEKGVSREDAEDHVRGILELLWKKMNGEAAKCCLPKPTVKILQNMARIAQCIFQQGDGIGTSKGHTKDRLISVIINPIPI